MSHIMEFKLREGAAEGNVEEMMAQIRKPGGEKENELPLGSVILLPSDFDKRLDEAGARKLVGERAGLDMDVLTKVVRRLQLVDRMLRDPGNEKFVELCAADFGGYPNFETVVNGKKQLVRGSYKLFVDLSRISAHEIAHRADEVKQFYTVAETLQQHRTKLEGMQKLVQAYLERVTAAEAGAVIKADGPFNSTYFQAAAAAAAATVVVTPEAAVTVEDATDATD